MVSLTTVYIVSVLLTSIASFGSAFAGKRFVGGGVSNIPDDITKIEKTPVPSAPLSEEDVPDKPVPSAPLETSKPVPSAPLSEEDNPSQVAGRISSFQH